MAFLGGKRQEVNFIDEFNFLHNLIFTIFTNDLQALYFSPCYNKKITLWNKTDMLVYVKNSEYDFYILHILQLWVFSKRFYDAAFLKLMKEKVSLVDNLF